MSSRFLLVVCLFFSCVLWRLWKLFFLRPTLFPFPTWAEAFEKITSFVTRTTDSTLSRVYLLVEKKGTIVLLLGEEVGREGGREGGFRGRYYTFSLSSKQYTACVCVCVRKGQEL